MRVDELTIGDLLQCGENPCSGHRVDYISEVDGEIGANGEIYGLQHLAPIPLTPEFLEKNNIPSNGDTHFFDEDKHYRLELQWVEGKLWWTINCAEYRILSFEYVHELQHALRLCGLMKSADGLII